MAVIPFFGDKKVLQRESHIRNLVLMANADNSISKSELQAIYAIGRERGFGDDEIAEIVKSDEQRNLEIPDSIDEKFEQLFDLTRVMLADGVIEDDEIDFCKEVATKYGFRKTISAILIALITREILNGKSRNQIHTMSLELLKKNDNPT